MKCESGDLYIKATLAYAKFREDRTKSRKCRPHIALYLLINNEIIFEISIVALGNMDCDENDTWSEGKMCTTLEKAMLLKYWKTLI